MGCRWPRISSTTVNMRPNRNVPGGAYEGIKQLPHHGHEFEYRITGEEQERVAGESRDDPTHGPALNGGRRFQGEAR
jgi:hypothetical protein